MNLFERWPGAYAKALAWSEREEEYVKRAGFVLMARLAQGARGGPNDSYAPFFAAIAREAGDARNGVKKAVSWALRQIGKRNLVLNAQAAALARELKQSQSPAARWVGADALRELTSPAVQERLAPPA
ncbi:MAG: DNA alkylation repair protein [Chloroflexi bacterium]|nr:DNA alkylation repair protein [Chloroflexota bacterium]MCL5109745.1 DNA alkylation repair protein [Chloroflexota bacterium]